MLADGVRLHLPAPIGLGNHESQAEGVSIALRDRPQVFATAEEIGELDRRCLPFPDRSGFSIHPAKDISGEILPENGRLPFFDESRAGNPAPQPFVDGPEPFHRLQGYGSPIAL